MKSCALLLLCCVAFSASTSIHTQFAEFQHKYGKVYQTQDELNHRFNIFKDNMEKARYYQALNPKATFGVNKFSDLSAEEFSAKYLMKVDPSTYVAPPPKDFSKTSPQNVRGCMPNPSSYDWTDCGCDTGIYNQGACGDCWAFSATETIESYYCLYGGGSLTNLAMEQIVDCDPNDDGCNGGWPYRAYEYVQSCGGLETLNDYPYTAGNGVSGQCQFDQSLAVATVTGWSSISGETGLYQQTSSSSGGPVSVCVDASSWQYYTGGILTSCGNQVDHAVQLVGYQNYGESGAYWIVRNSWGQDWGINGFIWLEIGEDLCSIGDYATVASVGSV
jgi:C1A family cysteine protease